MAAKDSAKKNPVIIIQAPTPPPGAWAKTSGSARKVIALEPPVTTPSGSSDTAKIAEITASPAMIEMLLLAKPW